MFKRLATCIVWFQEISIPSAVGIFALDPPPPSPPSRIPVTFQHGWFPPVGKIFPSKNAVALYYYAKKYAPSAPPASALGISVALLWREDMDIFGIRNSPFSQRP